MSFPAISQSVTVVNGNTLICFPELMVRQIMVDLETGDFCQQEKQSYLRDIENFRKLMAIKEQEYENILSRSRFSLCPRGSNPNSVRFWESLAAGAIPILISDGYKLPDWDWDNTIIRLKESDLYNLDYQELENNLLDLRDENERRANCLRAYEHFKHENYKHYITAHL